VNADRHQTEVPRKGRGGRRPGAGRKSNYLKRLGIKPIAAAEILARRHPQSASLSPAELETLHTITKKLAVPVPDAPQNQKESNMRCEVICRRLTGHRKTFGVVPGPGMDRTSARQI
jgi:hypothetical protein